MNGAWSARHRHRTLGDMTNERIILITGGSRGLGRAAALALAAAGTDIVLTYRAEADAAAAVVAEIEAEGRRAVALPLDTTDPSSFPAFADALRGAVRDTWDRDTVDGLLNNAGYAGDTPFGAIERSEIDRLVSVHFTGVVLLTQQLGPMIADGGRILNVSTGLSRMPLNPVYAVYAAVKTAVETWTLYLAKILGPRGITVNTVAPGATATDFAGGSIRDNEAYRAMILPTVALGRIGEPDDVGRAIAAILDERMAWVTGQRMPAGSRR
ncbi:MAG: family oxidoreductase [Microbacterium sp.]|nr:family oxidoreductase [Microbacterium sp.]